MISEKAPLPSSQPSLDAKPLVDPRISISLTADYEALKNDLDQATEFANDLQKELATNKNEGAHFKHLFERTRLDLERMQESILALRKERHHLANEVMKAQCWEMKLTMVTKERDELLASATQFQQTVEKRDAQIAELTMQVMLLKNTFRETRVAEIASKNLETAFIERFER